MQTMTEPSRVRPPQEATQILVQLPTIPTRLVPTRTERRSAAIYLALAAILLTLAALTVPLPTHQGNHVGHTNGLALFCHML